MMLLQLLLVLVSTVRSLNIYVSGKYGNDNNGLHAQNPIYPLKTLGATQRMMRKLIENEFDGNVTNGAIIVNIDDGIYEESLTFTNEDSGNKENGYIIWKSWHNNQKLVTISGGQQIHLSSFYCCKSPFDVNSNLSLLCANLSSLNITNIGQMKTGQLTDCQHDKLELYYNGMPQILARWPNINSNTQLFEYTTISKIVNSSTIQYNNSHNAYGIKYWSQEQNGWMHGYWHYDWADGYAPVSHIEFVENKYYDITSSVFNNTSTDNPYYAALQNARFYVVNMLSEIDTKTEYYVDKKNLILYWYPPQDKNNLNDNIVVSMQENVITLDNSSSYLSFKDLSISYSRISGISSVHNFVDHINVTNCSFSNHGNHGIDILGTNLMIDHNKVEYVGCIGISIKGGNYLTLTGSNNIVTQNNIYNFARWKRTYQPGIFWAGVGNIYSYNNITYGPHMAIWGGGNVATDHNLGGCNNVFEYNYIKNTTFEVDDTGSFDTCGQLQQGWINRGNILQHNTFENIRKLVPCTIGFYPNHGIYLDDQMSGWLVKNNTFLNCQHGINVGGGRRNILWNNYFLNCDCCVAVDNRGMTFEHSFCNDSDPLYNGTNSLWQGLYHVNYQQPPWSTSYPEIVNISAEQPCVPVFNEIENNQYCGNGTQFADFNETTAIAWNDTLKNNVYKCQ